MDNQIQKLNILRIPKLTQEIEKRNYKITFRNKILKGKAHKSEGILIRSNSSRSHEVVFHGFAKAVATLL